MNKFVTDTMAYILYLEKRKMPGKAKEIFNNAKKGLNRIFVPSIVIAEIGYLSEKNRIDINLDTVQKHLKDNPSFKEQVLDIRIIKTSFEIDDIPELSNVSRIFRL